MEERLQHPMSSGFPFSVAYVPEGEVAADDRLLAAIRFGSETRIDPDDPRLLTVGLPPLAGPDLVEVWRSRQPLSAGAGGGIRWLHNDDFLFAHLLVNEAEYPDMDAASYDAYRRILNFIKEQGFWHIPRIWNYFPDINREVNGLERYRAFCRGRYQALEEVLADFETKAPAACAIGTHTPGYLIYFLATREPGVQVENPRQVNAYRYPRRYGPRSPSFSRSVWKRWGAGGHLYVSGTASIVGHITRHPGDVHGQLRETLRNLEALFTAAGWRTGAPVRPALFKVYVRHPRAVEDFQELIEQFFGPVPAVFLHGDICRSDLLIEIEGMGIAEGGRGAAP